MAIGLHFWYKRRIIQLRQALTDQIERRGFEMTASDNVHPPITSATNSEVHVSNTESSVLPIADQDAYSYVDPATLLTMHQDLRVYADPTDDGYVGHVTVVL